MGARQANNGEAELQHDTHTGDLLSPLMGKSVSHDTASLVPPTVVVGELVALRDRHVPVVLYTGTAGPVAATAQTVLDLYGLHIGRRVVLMFEDRELTKPIVMGVLQDQDESALQRRSALTEVQTDGGRLIVTAKEQLVLRCGQASITLTKSGKVLIEGAYVSTRSSGVNRIKGGAVQIN
jgi:hypothetical protein